MKYIIDLKINKNVNYLVLHQEFDKILKEWDKIAIPVKKDTSGDSLRAEILKIMDEKHQIFFVYSAGSAVKTALITLAQMSNDNLFHFRYLMNPPQQKIVNNVEYYLWSFDKVDSELDNPIFN